jgi:hypothetical protein
MSKNIRQNEYKPNMPGNAYNKMRRNAWLAMGFCPMCLRPHDSFLNIQCKKCKVKHKVRNMK